MNENTPVQETNVPETSTPKLPERFQIACDVATGKVPADPDAEGTSITGAKKDLNSKGRGPIWYRMVYRGGWQYVSSDRLPNGSFLAADRRATVYGDVYLGEIVVSHHRGAEVDEAWLVVGPDSEGKVLKSITFSKRRDGQMKFVLPDDSEVVLPNPRARS